MLIKNYTDKFDTDMPVPGKDLHEIMASVLTARPADSPEIDHAIAYVQFILNLDNAEQETIYSIPFKPVSEDISAAKHSSAKQSLLTAFSRSIPKLIGTIRTKYPQKKIRCNGIILELHSRHPFLSTDLPESSQNPRKVTIRTLENKIMDGFLDAFIATHITHEFCCLRASCTETFPEIATSTIKASAKVSATEFIAFKYDPRCKPPAPPRVSKLTTSDTVPPVAWRPEEKTRAKVQRPLKDDSSIVVQSSALPKAAQEYRKDPEHSFHKSAKPNLKAIAGESILKIGGKRKAEVEKVGTTDRAHKKVGFAKVVSIAELSQTFPSTQSQEKEEASPNQATEPPAATESLPIRSEPTQTTKQTPKKFSIRVLEKDDFAAGPAPAPFFRTRTGIEQAAVSPLESSVSDENDEDALSVLEVASCIEGNSDSDTDIDTDREEQFSQKRASL